MDFSSSVAEVAEKYPEIIYEEVIIDNCCMTENLWWLVAPSVRRGPQRRMWHVAVEEYATIALVLNKGFLEHKCFEDARHIKYGVKAISLSQLTCCLVCLVAHRTRVVWYVCCR